MRALRDRRRARSTLDRAATSRAKGTARRREPRASRFFFLVALAVALVGAQFAQLSHFLLVPHSLCEHGDLVHADVSRVDRSADRDITAHAGNKAGAGHEHCDAWAVRGRAELPPSIGAPPVSLSFVDAGRVQPRSAHRTLAVLEFAPKSSPPLC